MTRKEKYDALISKDISPALERAKERKKNRSRLRESQAIAMKVLMELDNRGWTKKKLATEMGVTPQQVSKIVSGKENLTLHTQTQLQDILNIPILGTWYEQAIGQIIESFNKAKSTESYSNLTNNSVTLPTEFIRPLGEERIIDNKGRPEILESTVLGETNFGMAA